MTDKELLDKATEAMEKAYSPYSGFKVGAAIETADGRIFTGCNVENASFGATICAERTAAVKAVSEGAKVFRRIAIVGSAGEYTYPCGICRQFLAEFFEEDGIIVLNDSQKGIKRILFKDEMPDFFSGDCIK